MRLNCLLQSWHSPVLAQFNWLRSKDQSCCSITKKVVAKRKGTRCVRQQSKLEREMLKHRNVAPCGHGQSHGHGRGNGYGHGSATATARPWLGHGHGHGNGHGSATVTARPRLGHGHDHGKGHGSATATTTATATAAATATATATARQRPRLGHLKLYAVGERGGLGKLEGPVLSVLYDIYVFFTM